MYNIPIVSTVAAYNTPTWWSGRYVLKELCSYSGREKHALFARSRHTGLLKLHDDIKVHLYISRPPCGDAAAFPTITSV